MEVFDYVIILLTAVLLSNLINKFLPLLSVPLIQIILGVLITRIPSEAFGFTLDIELAPELFFVLFLSPLVFQATMKADLKTMQSMIRPIIMAAVGLVFVTIFAVGYLSYLVIPSISLAAAFALIAALAPTDIVAVEAVVHRVPLPKKIVSILSGESIINDATGIVCFQFAIIAAVTASFDVLDGLLSFLILAIGGILVGIFLSIVKYLIVRWLRLLNMKAVSLHVLLGIMTPFIIYILAEKCNTSGILAVFAAGICHSLFRDHFNPEVVNLNKANENVWSILSFCLDGLVFVILGTQLMRILQSSLIGHPQWWLILCYMVLVFIALALMRFLWWVFLVKKKYYSNPQNPISKIKSGLIFSIAGARGAVPMASILSIPLILPNGNEYPERDFLILIASGVIVISLLMTNFILPLFSDEKNKASLTDIEYDAHTDILLTVIERLKKSTTPENFSATQIITRNYYSRLNQKPKNSRKTHISKPFWLNLLIGEKELILHMVEMGQLSKAASDHHISKINTMINQNDKKKSFFKIIRWSFRHFFEAITWKESKHRKKEIFNIKKTNEKIVSENLHKLNISEDDPIFTVISDEHEKVISSRMGFQDFQNKDNKMSDIQSAIFEVAENAFYMEQILIQQMLESGRLSWKTAKVMQANIIMLEAQLKGK